MKSKYVRIVSVVAAVLMAVWFLASQSAITTTEASQDEKHPEADFSISCLECHQEVTPEVTQEWNEGQHGLVNVGCFVCHGDGEVEFYPKPTSFNCIGCHSANEVDFSKTEATNCFSCHDGHDLKFHN